MAYEKTNWVDNETPINAANLNKMEEGIVEASKTGGILDGSIIEWEEEEIPEGYEEVDEVDVIGSIISVHPYNEHTIATTNTKELLTMDTIISKIGNGLTIQNGKVVIGAGIKYIKLSGQLLFRFSQAGNVREMRIYKNNSSGTQLAVTRMTDDINGSWNTSISIPSILAKVAEGDTIAVYVTGVEGDMVAGSIATYLTVEAVG